MRSAGLYISKGRERAPFPLSPAAATVGGFPGCVTESVTEVGGAGSCVLCAAVLWLLCFRLLWRIKLTFKLNVLGWRWLIRFCRFGCFVLCRCCCYWEAGS